MGVEVWQVIYDRKVANSALPGTPKQEVATKTQAEAKSGLLTEKILVNGPVWECKMVEVEAETASMAAVAARIYLGANDGYGNPMCAKTANLVATAAR